jgi:branched-chain amino acid aminotransferase
LKITKTTQPKEKLAHDKLVFGRTFTDHMLSIPYTKDNGWAAPAIVPYGNLSLSPASNCLHYGIEVRSASNHDCQAID